MTDKPDNGPAAPSESIDVLAPFLPQVPNTAAHKADAMMARKKLTEEIGKLEQGPGEGDSAFGRKVEVDDAEAPPSERVEAIGLAPAAAPTKDTLRGLAPVVAESGAEESPVEPARPNPAPEAPAPARPKAADPSPDEPRVILNLPNQTQKIDRAGVNLHLAAMPTVRNLRAVPGKGASGEARDKSKIYIAALSAVILLAGGAAVLISRSGVTDATATATADARAATAATADATATADAAATADARVPTAEATGAPEATAAPTATVKTAPTVEAAPAASAKAVASARATASARVAPAAASVHPAARSTNVPYGGSKPEF